METLRFFPPDLRVFFEDLDARSEGRPSRATDVGMAEAAVVERLLVFADLVTADLARWLAIRDEEVVPLRILLFAERARVVSAASIERELGIPRARGDEVLTRLVDERILVAAKASEEWAEPCLALSSRGEELAAEHGERLRIFCACLFDHLEDEEQAGLASASEQLASCAAVSRTKRIWRPRRGGPRRDEAAYG